MRLANQTPQALCLVSSPIHLSVDPAQRRDELERLKLEKLHDARRFLDKRAQFTCPVTRFSESSLTTRGTDVSVVKFDVLPLRDAKGVKHAFDAFMYYFANLEIFATEELGDVTVREDDVLGPSKHKRTTASDGWRDKVATPTSRFSTADKSGLDSTSLDSDVVDGFTWADDECLSSSGDRDRDSGVAQHRFVRRHDRATDWPNEQHGRGLLIETNSALFAEYKARLRCPQSGEYREEGVIATDFVDQDELHPYQPRERMRKDVTTVLRFRSCVVVKRDKDATVPVESQSLANSASRRIDRALPTDLVGDMEADADADAHADADTDASTSTSSGDRCGVRERVVVLTMWYRATLRRGELAVSDDARQELVEDMHRVHSAMLRSARTALQYARLSS